ncbi:unnamed protein product [Darwinula stevensoni]|uniref:Nicotinamide/nicotinic acid mononucleotide adenylyltransferase 3 n=1 Tax=Darwinula stevensoni TaxID=69355 RepID=A0A7R9A2Q9_9CRUS|nr:unnamed protein product [Darwinula stevensoni]CAG0889184.1 unnamed protein product [Darwinula stevensoni]
MFGFHALLFLSVQDLVSSNHRLSMVNLAIKDSDWLHLSDWECRQKGWSRTRCVVEHFQELVDNHLMSSERGGARKRARKESTPEWLSAITGTDPITVKLLCGADLLESFAVPDLWAGEDMEFLVGEHGLVVITREGSNPGRFIYESDMLTKHQGNIDIVTEWVTNEISSTKIRRAARRNESIRYLVPDAVLRYISHEADEPPVQVFLQAELPRPKEAQRKKELEDVGRSEGRRRKKVSFAPKKEEKQHSDWVTALRHAPVLFAEFEVQGKCKKE